MELPRRHEGTKSHKESNINVMPFVKLGDFVSLWQIKSLLPAVTAGASRSVCVGVSTSTGAALAAGNIYSTWKNSKIMKLNSKEFTIVIMILFFPVFVLCQGFRPEELHGKLIVGEKPVDFNYLSAPDGTTEIAYFDYLPNRNEFLLSKGKKALSLHSVTHILITRLTSKETEFVRDSCPGCIFFRAKADFNGQAGSGEQLIYLAVDHLIWKNTTSKEFFEPRIAELRFLDAIYMNEVIK
jgi:hypothetical protein